MKQRMRQRLRLRLRRVEWLDCSYCCFWCVRDKATYRSSCMNRRITNSPPLLHFLSLTNNKSPCSSRCCCFSAWFFPGIITRWCRWSVTVALLCPPLLFLVDDVERERDQSANRQQPKATTFYLYPGYQSLPPSPPPGIANRSTCHIVSYTTWEDVFYRSSKSVVSN